MPQTSPMMWLILCMSIIMNIKVNMMSLYNKMPMTSNNMKTQINMIMWMW